MIGQTLGHYRIVEKIGAGGMGEVYRARDERLERDVAVKVLPAGTLADEAARKRFRKEALALSKLNHPNIATIFDFDTQDGVDFLVMEHISGETLADKLKAGPLPESQVLRVGAQVAEGLEAGHREGIVHRDIKPGNLRLTPDGRLKILDFGLAKAVQPAGEVTATTTTESLTQTQAIVGTLPYMAPEQLRGELVDARTDIYAAGAVLYEMATGQRPFPQTQAAELTGAILHQAPRPPRELHSRCSPGFERIILKALAKDPELRYQSAKELLVDLRRLAAPPVAGGRRPVVHRRWLLAGSGAVVVLLAILVGLNVGGLRERLLGPGRSPRIRSLAVLPLENFSRDPEQEYFADGMTEALITELSRISALKVISRTSVMQYKGAKKPLPRIARELDVDAVIEGSVLREGDQVRITVQLIHGPSDRHVWADSYQRELRSILALQSEVAQAIASEIRVQLTPQEQVRLAHTRPINPEAHELYLKGRYQWNKRTEEGFRKSIEYFQQAIEKDPTFAPAYVGVGDAYVQMGGYYRILGSREARPAGRAAVLKALELDENLGEAHASLANWYHLEGDWAAADKHFKRALESSPNYATAFHWYSIFLSAQGRHEEALIRIRRAQELDPLSAVITAVPTMLLFYARRYDDALEECEKVIRRFPDVPWPYLWRGAAYIEKGSFQNGIADLERAIGLGGRNPLYLGMLAYAYGRAGSRADALRVLRELEQLSKQRYVSGFDRALGYIGVGDKDEAMAWLEKAYEARDVPIITIKVSPWFDGLHNDPRFQALLRRMNFPE